MGGVVWLLASLAVVTEYVQTSEPKYLVEILGLLSVLWFEFGFAGLFHSIRRNKGRNLALLLGVTVVPPLLWWTTSLVLIWVFGKAEYPLFY